MNFKNLSISARVRYIVAAVMVVLIFSGLVVSIAILSNPKGTATKGEMTGEDIQKVDIMYSPETVAQFNIYFTRYLNHLFSSLDADFPSNGGIANLILKGFSAARIPADKALAFAEYLSNAKVENLISDILLSYFTTTGEGEDMVVEFNPDANIIEIFIKYANPIDAMQDLIDNTIITAQEAGRVLYYIVLSLSDENAAEVIKELGEEGFSAILLDGMQIYDLFETFKNGEKISRFEARLVREMLYEMGHQYNNILDKFGKEAIEDIFTASIDSSIEDTQIFMKYVNLVFKEIHGLPTYAIDMLGAILTTLDLNAFNALADYTSDKNPKQLLFAEMSAMITVSQAHTAVMTDVFLSEKDLINKCAKISAVLEVIGEIDKNKEPDMAVINQLTNKYLAQYTTLFAALKEFNNKYKDIADFTQLNKLNETDLKLLTTDLNNLSVAYQSFARGMNRLASLLLYNALYSLLQNSGGIIGG